MAHRHKTGTFDSPIEILDFDDDSHTFRASSFIDLTDDDPILPQDPSILQRTAVKNKGPSTSSALYPGSASNRQPRLPSRQLPLLNIQRASSVFKNKAQISKLRISSPYLVLHANREGSIEGRQQITSDDDADSKLSDIMDRSSRRSLRRVRVRKSRASEDTSFNTPRGSRSAGRGPSSQPKIIESPKTHDGAKSYQQSTSSLVSAMKEILLSIRRDIEEDYAVYVKDQLQGALSRINDLQASIPDFSDALDPFAKMPPINDRNVILQAKDSITIIDGDSSSPGLELSQIPERLPPYKHYITITRSFLAPDNHKLDFEPYLGQNDDDDEIATQRWRGDLGKLYDPPDDVQASRQRERISRLRTYLPKMLERLDLDREVVLSHVIQTGLFTIGGPNTPLAPLMIAFKNVFGTEISHVFPEYDEHLDKLKNVRNRLDEPEKINSVKKLLQPHLLSCPVCHVNLCGIHGVYEPDDSEDEGRDTDGKAEKGYADMNTTYEGIIQHQQEKSKRAESIIDSLYNGKPCGSNCFLISAFPCGKTPEWTLGEITYFKALFLGMQSEPRAACILAPLLARPCYNVQKFAISMTTDTIDNTNKESRKSEKLDWYDNKRKKIRVDLEWGKKTNTHLHDRIRQPSGCEHLGISCFEAKDDCSCNREKILCDKFCACPDDCYMKFTGCNCSNGDSPCSQESLTCPCKLLNRECDPDLCHSCGATQTANPFTRGENPPPGSCCNTEIQRGVQKRLLVGDSSHPGDIGFGAYTAEPVKEGEFISEYVGEMISYAECERRSEIYDKLEFHFMFDLNYEIVVDGYRYGNVERFINHSKKNANCKPIVKLVNGEHRIGFYATKDMDAGVELFFDYGKEFVLKRGLKEIDSIPTKKSVAEKAKGPSKDWRDVSKKLGGILEGAGNLLDEDDDMIMEYHDALPATVHGFPEEDKDGEGQKEEQKEARRLSRRPTRKVRKPKKYTR